MKAIIDTNILYYLSGVSSPQSIDIQKLRTIISDEWEDFLVSELSILEMLNHEEFSIDQLEIVLNYITNHKIRVLNFLPNEKSLLRVFHLDFYDSQKVAEIQKQAISSKVYLESELLSFVIKSAVVVLSIASLNELKDEGSKKRLNINTEALLEGNSNYIKDFASVEIAEFYKSTDAKRFKDNIRSLIYTLLYVVLINSNLSRSGILLSELENLTDVEKNDIAEMNNNDAFIQHILSKFLGKKSYGLFARREQWLEIEDVIEIFKKEIGREKKEAIAAYYARYLDKFYKTDKRFEKNNLIDSQFLEYHPEFEIITLDEDLRDSFRGFDRKNFLKLERLKNETAVNLVQK
jgi:predicted nucleic acid-binding protein